jgi:hypothetical protein
MAQVEITADLAPAGNPQPIVRLVAAESNAFRIPDDLPLEATPEGSSRRVASAVEES